VPDQTLRSIRADVDAATRSAQTSRTIDVPPSE
jgi:hypothetical protein